MQTVDFELLEEQLRALLAGESDFIANAANFAAFVYDALPEVNWAGFYLETSDGLVLGPFAGRPAAARIALGQGVCGRAFAEAQTVVVDDVNAFAGHITCDPASRSELVVPLLADGLPFGVFDLDSPRLGRFTESDRCGIEGLVATFLTSTAIPDTYTEHRSRSEAT